MFDLDVVPGKSLGPFVIGQPLPEVIQWLMDHEQTVHSVDISHHPTRPLEGDIVVTLVKEAVMLRFGSVDQRLKIAEVMNAPNIKLKYNKEYFAGPATSPTLVLIYRMFGPSYPGELKVEDNSYTLFYPGLTIDFPIPDDFIEYCKSHGDTPPLELPDGTTPVAGRLCIYGHGASSVMEKSATSSSLINHGYYYERVTVIPSKGIYLSARQRGIAFGAHCQDVVAELGQPTTISYKTKMPMFNLTESVEALSKDVETAHFYFYNYKKLGVDIMFDMDTHQVKKFILYTNLPGHMNFNEQYKCNFRIVLDSSNNKDLFADPIFVQSKGGRRPSITSTNSSRGSRVSQGDEGESITPETTFSEIQQLLGEPNRPVVKDTSTNANPFGPSLLYAYKNMVFEIMRDENIVSVTLFPTK